MATKTKIEWTDRTWNPVRGCSVISLGCHNCYAMRQGHRFSGEGKPYEGLTKLTAAGPQWTGVVRPIVDALRKPLSWQAPQRIFVNSQSDLFHERVPDAFIAAVFGVMSSCRRHTFQVLTKRPDVMRQWFLNLELEAKKQGFGHALGEFCAFVASRHYGIDVRDVDAPTDDPWPLPNVWLGVSVESQPYADQRIPLLLETPAAVRFISAEPLLERLALRREWLFGEREVAEGDPISGFYRAAEPCPSLDWVIVGGESGNGARPFYEHWALDVVSQCEAAAVRCFVKQFGANAQRYVGERDSVEFLNLRDPKGGDMAEWIAPARVRQFPEPACRS